MAIERNEGSGAVGAGVRNGRVFFNEKEGRLEFYNEDNELVAEIGRLTNPESDEPRYAVKLYKDSSIIVGENGTVRVGENLTIYYNRIILNDGVNDRMLIGYQENGF